VDPGDHADPGLETIAFEKTILIVFPSSFAYQYAEVLENDAGSFFCALRLEACSSWRRARGYPGPVGLHQRLPEAPKTQGRCLCSELGRAGQAHGKPQTRHLTTRTEMPDFPRCIERRAFIEERRLTNMKKTTIRSRVVYMPDILAPEEMVTDTPRPSLEVIACVRNCAGNCEEGVQYIFDLRNNETKYVYESLIGIHKDEKWNFPFLDSSNISIEIVMPLALKVDGQEELSVLMDQADAIGTELAEATRQM
jgi:hypothetical protein